MILRRIGVVLEFGGWFGALTFYSVVVIPTAHAVLGSPLRVGFITRGVAHGINAAGVAALGVFLWDLWASKKDGPGRLRVLSWIGMAAAQAGLLALHPVLDGHLDPVAMEISEPARFHAPHRIYLFLAAAQWTSALVHLWTVAKAWSGRTA